VSGEPHIRNVRPDELEQVWRVHVAASSDLAMRRGRPEGRADEPVSTDARAGLARDSDGYFTKNMDRYHTVRGLGALAYGDSREVEVRCV